MHERYWRCGEVTGVMSSGGNYYCERWRSSPYLGLDTYE